MFMSKKILLEVSFVDDLPVDNINKSLCGQIMLLEHGIGDNKCSSHASVYILSFKENLSLLGKLDAVQTLIRDVIYGGNKAIHQQNNGYQFPPAQYIQILEKF